MASSAICSRLYAPNGLSLRPAPRLSKAIDPVAQREQVALHVPAVLVGAEALDHQHRRRAAAAEHLVVDADAVGRPGVGHQRSPSQSSGVSPVR